MLYKYKAVLPTPNRDVIEFESKYFLSNLEPIYIRNAAWVFFEDAEVLLNISCLKDIQINGKKYKINPYYHKLAYN